jgi:hypothetical protein
MQRKLIGTSLALAAGLCLQAAFASALRAQSPAADVVTDLSQDLDLSKDTSQKDPALDLAKLVAKFTDPSQDLDFSQDTSKPDPAQDIAKVIKVYDPTQDKANLVGGRAAGVWIDASTGRGMFHGSVDGLADSRATLVARLSTGYLGSAGALFGEIKTSRPRENLLVFGNWQQNTSRRGQFDATIYQRPPMPGMHLIPVGAMHGIFQLNDLIGAPTLASLVPSGDGLAADSITVPAGPATCVGDFAASWALHQ